MKYGMGYPYLVPSDSKEPIEVEVYEVGSYVYNTVKVLTYEYIEEWAKKYITPTGVASASVIAQQFAKDH
jgi:hypothetical protein